MSDQSRVEQLLRNALGEDIYEVTPQSRVEELLVQLNELIEGISASVDPEELTPIVTAWLAENIHDGAVVDTSLSVAGAAAESKKTGEEISQLKEDINEISYGAIPLGNWIANTAINAGGEAVSQSNRSATDYITIPNGVTTLPVRSSAGATNCCAFYDVNKTKVGDNFSLIDGVVNVAVPYGAVYVRLSTVPTSTANTYIFGLSTQLARDIEINQYNANRSLVSLGGIFEDSNRIEIPLSFYRRTATRVYSRDFTDTGKNFHVVASDGYVVATAYADTNATFGGGWETEKIVRASDVGTRGILLWVQKSTSANITDAEISTLNESVKVYVTNLDIAKDKACYVATNGDDWADGSASAPVATVSEALSRGYTNILLKGGVYRQNIALPNSGTVKIKPAETTAKVVFENPNALRLTSATVYNDSVYVADADFSQLNVTPMIFQDRVADADTLISASDRMPQQRGKQYRCADTRIRKATATTLNDAVAEMTASNDYLFFYDSTGKKLYFTCPSSDFANHPIICPDADTEMFTNLSKAVTIEMTGIDCKYMRVTVANTVNSKISDCLCSGAYASAKGQFMTDNAINAVFIRCEACLSHGESNGDGFNGHASNSGDIDAHESGTILIDCWAHDNTDDGYSEHFRGESLIIGGLFEYNGKAGITPSYGTHCVCNGVYSRNNYNGFLCLNDGDDSGEGTQLECINCIAINNTAPNDYFGYGFLVYSNRGVSDSGHLMCANCYAEGNGRYGYGVGLYSGQTDYGTFINCTASGNTIGAIQKLSNATVKTGTALT